MVSSSDGKINVLIYALPNTNSGGLSVVQNLYEDIETHKGEFPNFHWYLIVGVDDFISTDTITVVNDGWALKTYLHRLYYDEMRVKDFVKEHDIKVVVSLNMMVMGLKSPSIISLHNVLPLYPCGREVFDKKIDMVKQAIRNSIIVKSLRRADYVIVPGRWIAKKLVRQFEIPNRHIIIAPIATPEVGKYLNVAGIKNKTVNRDGIKEFIYPSSGFPYKNHKVIVDAAKILKTEGITNFYIRMIGNMENGRTSAFLKEEIRKNNLPIEFSGLLTKEAFAWMYKTNTLIFPSKIETDGFPLLESRAFGGYIIAADLDYAREALQDYDNYDLFDPDDANRLAELMKNVINDQVSPRRNSGENTGAEFQTNLVKKELSRARVIVSLVREIISRKVDG